MLLPQLLYGARGANGVSYHHYKDLRNTGKAKITIDAKVEHANTRGEIEYDYIKDPGEYYQVTL